MQYRKKQKCHNKSIRTNWKSSSNSSTF